jgi:hypothetical protein
VPTAKGQVPTFSPPTQQVSTHAPALAVAREFKRSCQGVVDLVFVWIASSSASSEYFVILDDYQMAG